MAYRKLVTQSYVNLKGINQKMSEYTLDVTEFRDLRNLDFDVPNALQKRPGSTQALFEGTSGVVNSIFEYEKLNGFSQLLVGTNNALYYATSGNTLSLIDAGFTNGQPLDALTFVDKAWLANGETFINWDGVSQSSYQGGIPNIIDTAIVGSTHANPTFIGFTYPLLSAAFYASVGQSEVIGCFRGATFLNGPFTQAASIKYQGITNTFSGATAIAFYFAVGESIATGDGTPPGKIYLDDSNRFENNHLVFLPIGTTEVEIFDAGSGDYHLFANGVSLFSKTYGGTNTFSGLGFCFTATYIPKYVEVNNNVMFLSGFSASPSRMYFSEIGEPENVPAENLIEVRTNDGDKITGKKAFNSDLLIFKERSFHKLIGDDEDNYQLVEISTEYGCLSNKTIIEFQDNLAWLDQQGVVVYNGASWSIMSDQVQDIIRRMNLSAAREKSVGIHWKDRKQVWWSFPIDGATENNITIVFDYLVKAWTFFEGFNAASFDHAKRGLTRRTAYYGDYSGMVHYFGASFFGDNGQGITCLAKSRFEAPDGQNVQNIFRRLFLDVNNVSGITGTIDCKVFSDYSETVKATFSIYQNSFQTRRDFGVPAKSVAFEFSHFSASLPLLINGFATVRRYLRDV